MNPDQLRLVALKAVLENVEPDQLEPKDAAAVIALARHILSTAKAD